MYSTLNSCPILMKLDIFYYFLLSLLTEIEISLGCSSSYTSTDETNKNKYTYTKQYKNTVQRIQSTENTQVRRFLKILLSDFMGAALFLAGGRTDGHEANSRYSQFCERV